MGVEAGEGKEGRTGGPKEVADRSARLANCCEAALKSSRSSSPTEAERREFICSSHVSHCCNDMTSSVIASWPCLPLQAQPTSIKL